MPKALETRKRTVRPPSETWTTWRSVASANSILGSGLSSGRGDVAHVPRDEVHGSYNDFSEPCVFLAVLSENRFDGPAVIDMSTEEPWSKLRTP